MRASLQPSGGGCHRLRLNAAARRLANTRPCDRLRVDLRSDENPVAHAIPDDLHRPLRDEDLMAAFEDMPVGKRNHIVQWIESAARTATREGRIALALEVAQKRRARMIRAR
ncbi:MAG: hypothetical protein E6J78_00235 [Deltaproteobacteria bacterium]|nr:MAG: hypothetical protein E6J78_00235 [Deltaproteobacteria bacterium]